MKKKSYIKYYKTRVNTIEDINKLNYAFRDNSIYRGQSNSTWSIQSSIYRKCNQYNLNSKIVDIEKRLIYDFRKRYHLYDNKFPTPISKIDWLCVMQHYGAPTRLIDFSNSLYVALYFACEDVENDGALWVLNKNKLSILLDLARYHSFIEDFIGNNTAINSFTPGLLVPYEPNLLNKRMANQQGTFLTMTDPNIPFLESIENILLNIPDSNWAEFNSEFHDISIDKIYKERGIEKHENHSKLGLVFKIEINKTQKKEIRKNLNKSNIRTEILFPDLQGLGKSLFENMGTNYL